MTTETVVVAVTAADGERAGSVADAAVTVAADPNATVEVVTVFDVEAYQNRCELLGCHADRRLGPDEVAARVTAVRAVVDELERAATDHHLDVEVRGLLGTDRESAVTALVEDVGADHLVAVERRRCRDRRRWWSRTRPQFGAVECPVTFVGKGGDSTTGASSRTHATERTPLLWTVRGG
ncbi:hypothetical protein VB773_13880 [Haloarculaceae archaeon H-GB2-1]|nr:hypothetical protein [Haloarculaceae archaeon H-GB1-1]MEA5387048.1 hypothetical protein [Haloarculaceae archaeon H-GB11]MEA5408550.1 hypothetical protein [Haloarculaceae archaeon H-GB2-1]